MILLHEFWPLSRDTEIHQKPLLVGCLIFVVIDLTHRELMSEFVTALAIGFLLELFESISVGLVLDEAVNAGKLGLLGGDDEFTFLVLSEI